MTITLKNHDIWYGRLADGTEASIFDLISQEMTSVQASRIRIAYRNHHHHHHHHDTHGANNMELESNVLTAAQHLQQRYPELNRETMYSLYSPTKFSRKILPNKVAQRAVQVSVAACSNRRDCQEQMLALVLDHIGRHPSSLSRLGWRIDVFYCIEEDNDNGNDNNSNDNQEQDTLMWLVFSSSHAHVDGVAMHVVLNDFLDAFGNLLRGIPLETSRERLPLYSALPRDRLPFSWKQLVKYESLGWIFSKFLQRKETMLPSPKLWTNSMKQTADQTQQQRVMDGCSQRQGPFHVDFVELSPNATKDLCAHAHAKGITVGSLVHATLFSVLAKRYFQEHPDDNTLSLILPVSVNMRQYMIPKLPNTVLAPQQGDLEFELEATRLQMDEALSNPAKNMPPYLYKLALDSQEQVQNALNDPTLFKPLDGTILLSSFLSNGRAEQLTELQYCGDAWFSNVGLYRPSVKFQETAANSDDPWTLRLNVESTMTFNPTILAAYEMVWCNTTQDGCMTLSIVADETMGRNKASCSALLNEMIGFLHILIGYNSDC